MNRFLKSFYLWLGLFMFCNAVSIFAVQVGKPFSLGRWLLYPAAWLFQLPLVLFISVAHTVVNRFFSRFSSRLKKPIRFVLCALFAFVFMGMYAASQIVYQQIDTFISWDGYRVALSNAGQLIPDISSGLAGELGIIGVLALLFGLIYTRRYHCQVSTHSPRIFAVIMVLFVSSGAGGFMLVYNSDHETAQRIRKDILPTTFLTFSIIDNLLPSFSPAGDFLSDLILNPQISLDTYFKENPLREKPDVFLIMLESVSWDRYGFSGYERNVTPHLDALAEESLIFSRCYAAAPHSNYAQTSIHASQYPLRRKQLDQFEVVNYPKVMLFDLLSHVGYKTAFFSAQNEEWQGMKKFIHAGTRMQHFFHSKDLLGDQVGIESKITDETVREHAVSYLEQVEPNEPVFMYLNFQATHFPYEIPEGSVQPFQPCNTENFEFSYTRFDQQYLGHVINKYDNALLYVDQQVGQFIDQLKQMGRYENSLIVVAADHGEAFYEHGLPTHGTSLFEDQVRTAMLIKTPGQSLSGLREQPLSLIDLNPVVLELLGLPNHPGFQGESIISQARSEPIYMVSHSLVKCHGILDYPWKYIRSERDGELLLNVEEDPAEQQNLSLEYPDRLRILKEKLQRYQHRQLYYYNVLPQAERDVFYPPKH